MLHQVFGVYLFCRRRFVYLEVDMLYEEEENREDCTTTEQKERRPGNSADADEVE